MIRADSESSIFQDGERACNSKYASTFLFRSCGTSIPATLNIHEILLTTFQTSLSPGTPLYLLRSLLPFANPSSFDVTWRGAKKILFREIKFYPIVLFPLRLRDVSLPRQILLIITSEEYRGLFAELIHVDKFLCGYDALFAI